MDDKASNELSAGCEMRIKGDYAFDFEIDKPKVWKLIEDSEDFVVSITKYINEQLKGK